jgi:hypothetical protein
MVQNLQEWGKEHQLSQEGFEALVQNYTAWSNAVQEQRVQEEFKKLGANAPQRIQNVRTFLEGTIGTELTQKLAPSMTTSESVEAMEVLVNKLKGNLGTPAKNVEPKPSITKEQIEAARFKTNENGERLMSIDPEYRQKVLKMEQMYLKSIGKA